MCLCTWEVLVLILLWKETKDYGNVGKKNPVWLWKERDWTEECLGSPQNPSSVEEPDINVDRTENFNPVYNIELNSGLQLN